MKLHIAKEGDTLVSLSEKYEVEAERIQAANPQLEGVDELTRGTKVKIPSQPVTMRSETRAEAPAAQNVAPAAQNVAPTAQNVAPAAQNVPPAAQNVAPAAQNVAPAAQNVAPAAQNVPPAAQNVAPAAQNTAPAVNPQPIAPLAQYVSPNAANAGPNAPAAELPTTVKGIAPESFAHKAELAPEKAVVSGLPNMVYPFASEESPAAPTTTPNENASSELPSFYKTELPASNQSPLHVKWSGMPEGEAVHPYAPLPTPAVPAGAQSPTTYPPGPFGYGASQPGFPGAQQQPMWAEQPGWPGGMPYGHFQTPPTAFAPYSGAPAGGDCGCGGPPRLPYALPLRGTADGYPAASTVNAPIAPIADASRASVNSVAEAPVEAPAAPKAAKAKPAKKKAKTAPTNSLRAFLKQAKARPKSYRRGSKPWVND
ncbi:LysM peptidoglycan-binding domain-containing protein [Paenibacillus sp. TRM 82003]|nr:LysM peptidoglycan-binding domain-containing protein [Paenibacillus sp. TRM 82003]